MSIYFIDSQIGNDLNDGLSAEKPFASLDVINGMVLKAGDRVLLKKGCTFIGHLAINGSGEEYNPIIVSSYGNGLQKPIISGGEGDNWCINVSGEYVTVKGLEVTNPKGMVGISVKSEIHGATHGIIITECYIHDVWTVNNLGANDVVTVNGCSPRLPASGWSHAAGGISVETNKEAPTWFENTRIENNFITNVNRTGIWFGGQWFNRFRNSFPWATNKAPTMNDPWYPHKNIYIGHNTVDHAHGDGIIGIGCQNLLMEYNRVYYANCMSRVGGCNAGLWSMCCDGALIQYNEVAYTGLEYGGDGEALDIDNCSNNTIVQYNYTHDNAGGFILICNITCNSKESHHNNIVRNNLSVNDATKTDAALFNFTGAMRDVSILNNTVYTENENRYCLLTIADYAGVGLPRDVLFGNNIIYCKNSNHRNHIMALGKFVFDSNIFWNTPPLPDDENIVDNNIYNVNPTWQEGETVPGTRLETSGYVPCWNSPLLRLGKHFEDCADKDYCGIDTKGHNYIGAFYYKDANIG